MRDESQLDTIHFRISMKIYIMLLVFFSKCEWLPTVGAAYLQGHSHQEYQHVHPAQQAQRVLPQGERDWVLSVMGLMSMKGLEEQDKVIEQSVYIQLWANEVLWLQSISGPIQVDNRSVPNISTVLLLDGNDGIAPGRDDRVEEPGQEGLWNTILKRPKNIKLWIDRCRYIS